MTQKLEICLDEIFCVKLFFVAPTAGKFCIFKGQNTQRRDERMKRIKKKNNEENKKTLKMHALQEEGSYYVVKKGKYNINNILKNE